MSYTQTAKDGLISKYKVDIDAAAYQAQETAMIAEMKHKINVPGFRKGKVPSNIVKTRMGANLKYDIINKLVPQEIDALLKHHKITPVTQPKLLESNFDDVSKLSFELEIEQEPDFPEVKFADLTIKRFVFEPSEADLKNTTETFQKQHLEFTEAKKDAVAKIDDRLAIDFEGKVDGEAFDGNKATDFPIILGSKGLIPGFEDQLVGTKVGDKKEVKVTFPSDYPAKNLAGKEAVFDTEVKKIEHSAVPKVDAKLFEKFHVKTKDEFMEIVNDSMTRMFESYNNLKMRESLFDELDKLVEAECPPSLLKNQEEMLINGEKGKNGGELDDKATKELQTLAKRRVKLGLFLAAQARKASVAVTDQEVNSAIQKILAQYPGQEQMIAELYRKNPGMIDNIRSEILENKMVEHIFKDAKFADTKIDFATVKKELDEE